MKFLEFQEIYYSEFGEIAERYPLATSYFDVMLRQLVAQRIELYRKNVEKLHSEYGYRKRRAKIKLSLSKGVSRDSKSKIIICTLPQAPAIADIVGSISEGESICMRSSLSIRDGFFNVSADDMAISSRGYQCMLSVLKSAEVRKIRRAYSEFDRFNEALNLICSEVANSLNHYNVIGILSHNLHFKEGYILAKASQMAGIPTIEVAHGFTADPLWMSVWPIHADYEVLWSHGILKRAEKDWPDARRARSFGAPFMSLERGPVIGDSVLLLLDPLFSKHGWEKLKRMESFGKVLVERGAKIQFRAHPKCKSHDDLKVYSTFLIDHLSEDSLAVDLNRARAVVGTVSSVLAESVAMGIPSYQLNDGEDIMVEGAKTFNVGEAQGFLHRIMDGSSAPKISFEKDYCESFLRDVLLAPSRYPPSYSSYPA